nr:radical SAM protein [Methanothermus fervidus]
MNLKEFKNCKLCEWKCGVNRIKGERGVCRSTLPEIAYTSITYLLKTYAITFLGCSFRCFYCNAYRISQYPDTGWIYRGYVEPEKLGKEILRQLESKIAKKIGVSGISFTGGEPSIHLPYIEEVIKYVTEEKENLRIGFATNGFATKKTFKKLVKIASFINFEIKAFDNDIHQNLTGAPVDPVLRNAEYLAKNHPEKIRVFRSVVIPKITDSQVLKIAEFIKDIDPSLNYKLIGFRPNFVLYYHAGPSKKLMEKLVKKCKEIGLKNVNYSGYYPKEMKNIDEYVKKIGCPMPRNCGKCKFKHECKAVLMEPWLFK